MNTDLLGTILDGNLDRFFGWITSPSVETLQLVAVIYLGLLWLSVIIWVTRDAIHRSNSIFFQAFAILLNIVFPVLGILLYLIIRPGKTTLERYYEELEHHLIIENIEGKKSEIGHPHGSILRRKAIRKTHAKHETQNADQEP